MFAYFILGVGVLIGLLLLARWMANADPKLLAWLLKLVGGIVVLGLAVLIILTDRLQLVIYALPFALPFYFRWRSNRMRQRNARGPASGGRSTISTGWITMELDHDSGAMRGTVQRGRFSGRGLAGMTIEELRELFDEVGEDADSAGVLEAYLDRTHGPDWRRRADGDEDKDKDEDRAAGRGGGRSSGPAPRGGMSAEEALEILGLSPGASAEEIKEAHRRLMSKLHPDRGGSTYLAAKLNQAKDALLKSR
ncbi:MAG: hypothetical protein RL477_1805 [Pseudomonadota bacterium]